MFSSRASLSSFNNYIAFFKMEEEKIWKFCD